ncbi:MAG: hypothetical protein M3072_09520 [Candidatus Dormibacteraeota bacterium]|nr:hypothetical protein [Candidatus Dormibacteraeota bacterium]
MDRGQAGPELGDQLFGDLASLVLLGLAGQPRRDPQAPPGSRPWSASRVAVALLDHRGSAIEIWANSAHLLRGQV